jgi:predicted HTH domain antitoxin
LWKTSAAPNPSPRTGEGSKKCSKSFRIAILAAITYFQGKQLSLGKAAELAGINRLEFMDILSQKGITLFDYDKTELETELMGISQLRGENDS